MKIFLVYILDLRMNLSLHAARLERGWDIFSLQLSARAAGYYYSISMEEVVALCRVLLLNNIS